MAMAKNNIYYKNKTYNLLDGVSVRLIKVDVRVVREVVITTQCLLAGRAAAAGHGTTVRHRRHSSTPRQALLRRAGKT